MKKIFVYLLNEKTEFIPSSEIMVPKSGIFTNNYWVGWVEQSNFAGQHISFSGAVEKIFFERRWLSSLEKIGPYAYEGLGPTCLQLGPPLYGLVTAYCTGW